MLAFVRASLPQPPARVLEVGAGKGELAAAPREGGYDVDAVDPSSEDVERSEVKTVLQAHLHPVSVLHDESSEHLQISGPIPGPYLHRWLLPPGLREAEIDMIGRGELPPRVRG